MRLFDHGRDAKLPATPTDTGAGAGKLSGVRPVFHDDDERPSREDRGYGETIFTRPAVPLPRLLTGRKTKRKG
jgi:hypothetical protein